MVKVTTGNIYMTPGVQTGFTPGELWSCLTRHASGDWGQLDAEDWGANDVALQKGGRLLSAYILPAGKLWIITEADRGSTTMLLPEEY